MDRAAVQSYLARVESRLVSEHYTQLDSPPMQALAYTREFKLVPWGVFRRHWLFRVFDPDIDVEAIRTFAETEATATFFKLPEGVKRMRGAPSSGVIFAVAVAHAPPPDAIAFVRDYTVPWSPGEAMRYTGGLWLQPVLVGLDANSVVTKEDRPRQGFGPIQKRQPNDPRNLHQAVLDICTP
jgi:hypothetical protein